MKIPISKLFVSGIQENNIAHLAAMANIAAIDGEINEQEEQLLLKFAKKLDIGESHYQEILEDPDKYPINPPNTKLERLEYIYDLFKMIYADHEIDEPETRLIYRYAIGLGCSSERAKEVIEKSIKIFGGSIDFEDYQFLIEHN